MAIQIQRIFLIKLIVSTNKLQRIPHKIEFFFSLSMEQEKKNQRLHLLALLDPSVFDVLTKELCYTNFTVFVMATIWFVV